MDGGTWWATVHGGRCKSGMTERLHFHFSLFCIGEGNGNPLQCSCLENPRDRGAWWAAVYGVAQSRTRLKRLSGSSSNPLQYSSQNSREFNGLYSLWGCKELVTTEWEKKKKSQVNHFKTDGFILEYTGFISSSPTGSSRHSKHTSTSLSLTRPSWLINKVFHLS